MKIIKKTSNWALAICAGIASVFLLGSPKLEAQLVTNTADYTGIALPFTTLMSTNAALTTNLSSGWFTVTTNTTVSTFWSNSIAALVSVTNSAYNTNTYYADFTGDGQATVPLQFESTTSANNSNLVFFVNTSVTGNNYDTNQGNCQTFTNSANGTTPVVANWNVTMNGRRFGRVLWVKYLDITFGEVTTNRLFVKGNKRN